MKKILMFLLLSSFALVSYAQDDNGISKRQSSELDQIKDAITFERDNLFLKKNQVVKMNNVLKMKHREIERLRNKGLEKRDYVDAHQKLDKKYEPMIEAVLTSEQTVMYRKWKNPSKRSKHRKAKS